MDSVLHAVYNRSLVAQYCFRDVINYNFNSQKHVPEIRTPPEYMKMFKSNADNTNNNNSTANVMARLAKKYQSVGTIPTQDWSWKGETQVLGSGVYGTAVRGVYLPTKKRW